MAQQSKIGNSDKSPTAVEWLKNNLETFGDPEVCTIRWEDLDSLMLQANKMFEEQIMKAVDRGFDEGCKHPEDITLKDAEQYYNETYGKE
jgi:hypothetical protein